MKRQSDREQIECEGSQNRWTRRERGKKRLAHQQKKRRIQLLIDESHLSPTKGGGEEEGEARWRGVVSFGGYGGCSARTAGR